MWPFTPPKACQECSALRREFKSLERDFLDFLDKANRAMKRTVARETRAATPEDDAAPDEFNGTEAPASRVPGLLMPRRRA